MGSAFKHNEVWRHNQNPSVMKYFSCRLSDCLEHHQPKKITQTDLAKLLGKSSSTISVWVNGHEMPPDDIQEHIAHILGLDSRADVWIFKGDGKLHDKIIQWNKLESEKLKLEEEIKNELNKN